jgi:hypothetical protein
VTIKRSVFLAGAIAIGLGSAGQASPTFSFSNSIAIVPGPGFNRVELGNSLGVVPDPVGTNGSGTAATGFTVTATSTDDASIAKKFLAWCLDFSTSFFNPSAPRTETGTLNASTLPAAIPSTVASGAQGRILSLFNVAFPDITQTIEAQIGSGAAGRALSSAFQLAIWEAVFDDDWDVNDTTGRFWAVSDTASGSAISQAQSWLAAAESYGGPDLWRLTFYTSPTNQDVVTATPIPLPAGVWMMLMALGGIGLAARKRRAAG